MFRFGKDAIVTPSEHTTYKTSYCIYFHNWDERRIVGWASRIPKVGDLLDAELDSGRTGTFRFIKIDDCADPADMFFADVEDVGYKGEV